MSEEMERLNQSLLTAAVGMRQSLTSLEKELEATKESLETVEGQFRHTKTREMALREAVGEMIEDAEDNNTSRICRVGTAALAASSTSSEGNPLSDMSPSTWYRIPEGAVVREVPASPETESGSTICPCQLKTRRPCEACHQADEWLCYEGLCLRCVDGRIEKVTDNG